MNDPEAWYRGRTIAITGAYGYLGTGLSALLEQAGATVRRATRGRSEADAAWVGSLIDASFCRRLVAGADAVFHLAAQTSVPQSWADPLADLRENVESTVALLKACADESHKPAFVYAGTATQIGLTTSVPIPAGQADLPITVYDANKLAAEQLVGVYTSMGAVAGVTLRIANVYGPGAAKSAPERGVVNKLIARAMAGQNLTYYGDGDLVRDYVYIADLLRAFQFAAPAAPRADRRSYVIAGGGSHTLREAFETIADVVASLGFTRVQVSSVPWPKSSHPIDRRSFTVDITAHVAFSGWRPRIPFAEGIRLTAEAFRRGAVT
ncbi:MAG: NAD-dependent epimerase/dehydratase family protein [Pseudomonadota bacterium]